MCDFFSFISYGDGIKNVVIQEYWEDMNLWLFYNIVTQYVTHKITDVNRKNILNSKLSRIFEA